MPIKEGSSSDNPVPSITLSITHDDVKRVLDASKTMAETLTSIQKRYEGKAEKETVTLGEKANENGQNTKPNPVSTPLRTVSTSDASACSNDGASRNGTKSGKRPLHEMIFQAAEECEHPMLKSFLDKMKASGSTLREMRAGIMVFHDIDITSKIKLIFEVLGDESTDGASAGNDKENPETTLSRNGALSLFRSIIIAISSCIHQDSRVQIEMEKGAVQAEPPAKRRKIETTSPGADSSKSAQNSTGGDSVPELKSPSHSFDSAMVPVKEDDDFTTSTVRKEFEDIATYAADRLLKYANKQATNKSTGQVTISHGTFEGWKKAEGGKVAPWLELMDLSRWKTPVRNGSKSQASTSKQKKEAVKDTSTRPTIEAAETPKITSENKVKKEDSPKEQIVAQESTSTLTDTEMKPAPEEKTEEVIKKEAASPEKQKEPLVKSTPAAQMKKRVPESLPALAAPSPPFFDNDNSRTVVTFDFAGSMPETDPDSVFKISITEENLMTLRNLVQATGLCQRSSTDITDILLGASKSRVIGRENINVLPIERFHTCLHQLLGSAASRRLAKADKDIFSSCFVDFFSCFDTRISPLESGEADAKNMAVGFCFLCAGNKSAKLATGFEIIGSEQSNGLTDEQLEHYLRSYLTMLVGISLLTSASDGVMKPKFNNSRRKAMLLAVENGAKWTLNHFLETAAREGRHRGSLHTFEDFANWYTAGGYNIAPWLELLDLRKLLCLIGDTSDIAPNSPELPEELPQPAFPGPKHASSPTYASPPRRQRHSSQADRYSRAPPAPPAEVLFTFPLANQRSLVVLREDASYVKGVVDQLGLLNFSPDDVWECMYRSALKRPTVPSHRGSKSKANHQGKSMLVDKSTFVECMQETIDSRNRSKKRSSSGVSKAAAGAREVLVNFFHSFDLLQVDRVALNELMGGLTLLCGGKKSTKLAFGFGVFDQRPKPKSRSKKKPAPIINSLGGEDLFLFLRSFLIVMFSCCRQSWDLSDDAVNRYIADTANMVTDDVMRYQWSTRKKDRVDFDDFGQWYNEGGFETAPWLELLDLKKWVLVDNFESIDTHRPPPLSPGASLAPLTTQTDMDCPPPPPEDSVDPAFFDDDPNVIMPMDSIDEMDILLMQPTSDKSNDENDLLKLTRSFSYSPTRKSRSPPKPSRSPARSSREQSSRTSNSLKFHLITDDDHGGYVVSVSQKRICHLRHVLTESGLHRLDGEIACKQILGKAYRDKTTGRYSLTKDDFDSAMRGVIASRNMSVDTQRTLSDMLGEIFAAFDHDGTRTVNAVEVACGFTVLCKGKKSDKLEYAFEVLDRDRRGNLSRSDTAKYLRSFLIVLLNITSTKFLDSDRQDDVMTTTGGMRCERSMATMARVVEAGSSWAAAQAFRNRRSTGGRDLICFDEFAEWYTHVGYSNIPWLELLDLQKWVMTES